MPLNDGFIATTHTVGSVVRKRNYKMPGYATGSQLCVRAQPIALMHDLQGAANQISRCRKPKSIAVTVKDLSSKGPHTALERVSRNKTAVITKTHLPKVQQLI